MQKTLIVKRLLANSIVVLVFGRNETTLVSMQ